MTDYKQLFENWKNEYFDDSVYKRRMENTVETSPYHLEDNVWVHTQMVLDEYMNQLSSEWSKEDFMGAIAVMFHDTGKPYVEEEFYDDKKEKWKKRYSNHEYYSGGLFIDYVLGCYIGNYTLRDNLSDDDIYNIWVMIAYHMPYQYNNERLSDIKTHFSVFGLLETYFKVLWADCLGRIYSQDISIDVREGRTQRFIDKVNSLKEHAFEIEFHTDKIVTLLCGVTGAGKTTIANETMDGCEDQFAYHSMDQCRYDFYGYENYTDNFKASMDDKDFSNREYGEFLKKMKKYDYMIVDNTHISYNKRKKYIQKRKKDSIFTCGILKVVSYGTNVEQCMNRKDKYIGQEVVDRMYFSFQPILLGEFDAIKIEMEYD